MNASTHTSVCHWSDIILNIKVDVDLKFTHVAMGYVCISESVQELVISVVVITPLIILGNSVCQCTFDLSLIAVPPRVILKFSFDNHLTCHHTRPDPPAGLSSNSLSDAISSDS